MAVTTRLASPDQTRPDCVCCSEWIWFRAGEKSECDEGRCRMEAEAEASGAALSALCWLPSVLLAFLVLLSAFMPQTGCPAIGHIFFLYISLYTYIHLFFWPIQLSGACRLGGFKWKAKVVAIRWSFLFAIAGCLKPLPLYLTILPLDVLSLLLLLLLLRLFQLLLLQIPIHPLGHQSIFARIKLRQGAPVENVQKEKWKRGLALVQRLLGQFLTLTCSTLIDPHSVAATRPARFRLVPSSPAEGRLGAVF